MGTNGVGHIGVRIIGLGRHEIRPKAVLAVIVQDGEQIVAVEVDHERPVVGDEAGERG